MILEMTRSVQGGIKQERKLDMVTNNLANSETIGFNKDIFSFNQQLDLVLDKDFSEGPIITTGNPLDFAISGRGFFKIDTPQGIRYTRNGNFSLDANGVLVDQGGNPVMGQGGAIAINSDNVEMDLAVDQNGGITLGGQIIDSFDIVNFPNTRKMQREGRNLLSYDGETTDEIQAQQIVLTHKALEKSNVSAVEEMARMIEYHRMFETYTKSMMTFDEIDGKAINDVGKLR